MSTEQQVKALAQRVVRLFYGTMECILIDQLIKKPAVKDEELAGRLGVKPQELARVAQHLIDGGIVRSHVRNELRDGAQRVTPRVWYYQDGRHFLDVLKWRIFHIRKALEEKHSDEIAAQGYLCPLCKKTFSLLDIQHCVDFATGAFYCDICGTELQDNDSVNEINSSRDQVKRFLDQCKVIIDALQKSEETVLPRFEIARWLHVNFPIDKTGAAALAPSHLTVGPSPSVGTVTVKIETEETLEAKKRQEAAEELAWRETHAQPTWFAKSTLEADRATPSAPEADVKPDTIKLEDEENDDDDDDALFGGVTSAASTPATSLEHSGILSNEGGLQTIGKRLRDEEMDESDDSQSKKIKIQPPSSPHVVETAVEARDDGDEDDDEGDEDDDLFEAVEPDGGRLVSCGGDLIAYEEVEANIVKYRDRMTDAEWQTFLQM